ncbi:hypothetical protein Bca52824_095883 [Brassica carinata]|uniref:Uncharacterized protein n=1 Tax=Brassica carinata TaxID=52824 RepID=A0A8X7P2K0_BRACI|nr:hypothetical protein Bca52824_095883 [Brassica carinata]
MESPNLIPVTTATTTVELSIARKKLGCSCESRRRGGISLLHGELVGWRYGSDQSNCETRAEDMREEASSL